MVPASAWQHPPGYGEICYPCHDLLLTEEEKISKFAHCGCHSRDIWNGNKVVMEKVSKLHGLNTCLKCHCGLHYDEESLDIAAVHAPHKNVSCSACHGVSTIVKPKTMNCYDCHRGGIHEIHYDVLKEICVACHGEVIHKFTKLKEEAGVEEVKERPKFVISLYDIIQRIISFIFGGF